MSSYVGGPFDDRRFTTAHDASPILRLGYFDIVDGKVVEMIAEYELKCGMRIFIKSYPKEKLGGS